MEYVPTGKTLHLGINNSIIPGRYAKEEGDGEARILEEKEEKATKTTNAMRKDDQMETEPSEPVVEQSQQSTPGGGASRVTLVCTPASPARFRRASPVSMENQCETVTGKGKMMTDEESESETFESDSNEEITEKTLNQESQKQASSGKRKKGKRKKG